MKPAPFDYYRPATTEEALANLDELGYSGKVLAGGQSLIPAMNFRVARPSALVDLNTIKELFFIKPDASGGLVIGTMTRASTVEHNPEVKRVAPIIAEALAHVGHPQIRNRGTFGGNIAHADPAGQMPGITVALTANMRVRSKNGDRWVCADDFFMGPFTPVVEPHELLTEIQIPAFPAHTGMCYQQVSRQRGSQYLAGVAVVATLDSAGRCQALKMVMMNVGEVPIAAVQAAALLIGQTPTPELIKEAALFAAAKEIDPGNDIHATAEYRRHAAGVLAERALITAFQRAAQ